MSACRSCGHPIVWAKHPETGKAMPIDDASHPLGNVRLNDDGTFTVLGGTRWENSRNQGEALFRSHFATCPNAKRWRNP